MLTRAAVPDTPTSWLRRVIEAACMESASRFERMVFAYVARVVPLELFRVVVMPVKGVAE
jgi:hypothetical protein